MIKKQFRIPEAIALQNARQEEINNSVGFPLDYGKVNPMMIAKILYPNQTNKTRYQSSHIFMKGKRQKWSADQLEVFYHLLEVDPNFMQDFPSIHDDDYNRLVKNQTTK